MLAALGLLASLAAAAPPPEPAWKYCAVEPGPASLGDKRWGEAVSSVAHEFSYNEGEIQGAMTDGVFSLRVDDATPGGGRTPEGAPVYMSIGRRTEELVEKGIRPLTWVTITKCRAPSKDAVLVDAPGDSGGPVADVEIMGVRRKLGLARHGKGRVYYFDPGQAASKPFVYYSVAFMGNSGPEVTVPLFRQFLAALRLPKTESRRPKTAADYCKVTPGPSGRAGRRLPEVESEAREFSADGGRIAGLVTDGTLRVRVEDATPGAPRDADGAPLAFVFARPARELAGASLPPLTQVTITKCVAPFQWDVDSDSSADVDPRTRLEVMGARRLLHTGYSRGYVYYWAGEEAKPFVYYRIAFASGRGEDKPALDAFRAFLAELRLPKSAE